MTRTDLSLPPPGAANTTTSTVRSGFHCACAVVNGASAASRIGAHRLYARTSRIENMCLLPGSDFIGAKAPALLACSASSVPSPACRANHPGGPDFAPDCSAARPALVRASATEFRRIPRMRRARIAATPLRWSYLPLFHMPGTNEIIFLSAAEQGRLIRERKLSPVELVQACLDRIDRYDPVLRAYITVCADQALAQARQAEQEILGGNYRGPLHGLPFGAKDQLCTRGIRTTLGSRIMANHVPDFDATVITRLRVAGAVLIGKENLHEFGKGGTNVFAYGQPRNPWNPERTPSSSSSGSGIAPAAGFSSGSLGEDTGGSVRGPAAANGVVGIRPTFGRVSRHGGVMHAWTADTIGPLTRTVEDNALFLAAIAGFDADDRLTGRQPVPDYAAGLTRDVKGMRLAVVKEMSWAEGVHAEV